LVGGEGLAVFRREGLLLQLVVEVLITVAAVIVLSLLGGRAMNPIVFLMVLYGVTMRSRLAVDAANLLAAGGIIPRRLACMTWRWTSSQMRLAGMSRCSIRRCMTPGRADSSRPLRRWRAWLMALWVA